MSLMSYKQGKKEKILFGKRILMKNKLKKDSKSSWVEYSNEAG